MFSILEQIVALDKLSMALFVFLFLISALFIYPTMALLLHQTPSLSLSSSVSALADTKRLEIPPATQQIHLCVLIHGWLGSPSEMLAIQRSLDAQIRQAKGLPIHRENSFPRTNERTDADDVSSIVSSEEEEESSAPVSAHNIPDDTSILMHSVTCNENKTTDGVLAGGSRVAKEVNDLIKELLVDSEAYIRKDVEISISFIGNSLGGLYARAALAELEWELPNGKKLIPNVFCTTATPHLGKRGQTYVRLPRFAETGIGLALQPTGQDLFGLNQVIEDLATDIKYIEPLKQFRKRIAYANAFGTDLQVPTATAAFLADTESPHYTQESKPPFLLTVTTPRDETILKSVTEAKSALASSTEDSSSSLSSDQSTKITKGHIPASTIARTLDACGWTKVFCDVRDKLFSVPVPFRSDENSSEFKVKESWSSHDLKSSLASQNIVDKRWSIPFGHTMLIANSKSELYAKLNSGGKPFVEALTSDFLEDILDCDTTS